MSGGTGTGTGGGTQPRNPDLGSGIDADGELPAAAATTIDAPAAVDSIVTVHDLVMSNSAGTLLNGVSFDIRRGEIFVILGASGCGKSTLLKHMIGQYQPAGGDIRIEGASIVTANGDDHRDIMRRIGVLYQSGALFGSMTLQENVSLPLEEHTDLPADTIANLARLKLAAVNLAGFEDYLPDQISGGMKKRAGLARAMALSPPLLFLDEPSAGLDPISAAELDQLILALRDDFGVTFIIVTHELDSINSIADRVIILQNRAIGAIGPLQQVKTESTDPWIRSFFSRAGTKAD